MAIKKLERVQWTSYFDRFSRDLVQKRRLDYAEIRIFSEEAGAQQETRWLPLKGITYDRKSDLLDVAVENMGHLILHPADIYVDEVEPGVVSALEVIRRDGTKEVIEIR